MNVVVVIPTYNEKDNIKSIIAETFAATKESQDHIAILVVDDHSPDGTGDVVQELAKDNPRIHLLSGEKQGLGMAYIRGFKYAMDSLGADVVIEMDADGSHNPKYILPMLQAIHNGADVAVGTRYINGGSIPSNWGLNRKIMSVLGNVIARVVLLTPQYHDMTTGFRATRTSMLRKINLDGLLSKRFAYKIHLFHAMHIEGAKIVEIPFAFIDREKGYSKMPKNEVLDSLRVIFLIRMYESATLIKFLTVGTIGFIVNGTMLTLLYDTKLGFFLPQPKQPLLLGPLHIPDLRLFLASVIAVEISIFSNFNFHEHWTYKSHQKNYPAIIRFLRYNLSSIVSPLISVATVNILTPHFGVPKLLSLAIGTILGLTWNYTMNMLFIWKPHKPGVAQDDMIV